MDPAFAASLDLPGSSLEGYLFPDTYRLRPHTPAARALIPLVRRHRQVFEELRAAHAKGVAELVKTLGFDDPKIVVLASIVEKETGQVAERPRIAQVFINRLKLPTFSPKLLQTDPTIIYGCTVAMPRSEACSRWDGRIRRIQLEDRANPYNTYTHEGLPPGPIEPRPRGAGGGHGAGSDAIPLFRFEKRWHALLLAHGRRARGGGHAIPTRPEDDGRGGFSDGGSNRGSAVRLSGSAVKGAGGVVILPSASCALLDDPLLVLLQWAPAFFRCSAPVFDPGASFFALKEKT
jgi:hypothetical protein